MAIISVLSFLPVLLLLNTSTTSTDIPDWIKDNAEKLTIQNNSEDYQIISFLTNLSNTGMIKNPTSESSTYGIPDKGKIVFVNLSGNVNEYRKTGFVSLEISKPDGSKEILRTPILETGKYSTVFQINEQSQKGTYRILAEFAGNNTSVTYFHLVDNDDLRGKIPSWFVTVFHWWLENKISDEEFIQNIQHLMNNDILIIFVNDSPILKLQVSVEGQHQVRRGTTHTIISHVTYGGNYIEGAKISLTIEDYGENIIREFDGFTNEQGDFVFSWEIPKKFDDIENLLAYIDVTYNDSSITKLFRFQVYCLPGESNCNVEGN
jgi:hypothetical protein